LIKKTQIQFLKFLLLLLVFLGGALRAEAGVPFFIIWEFSGEKTTKVADFPQTDDFKDKEGDHFDAGCIYSTFKLFWIPVWNYDVRWCGFLEKSNEYVPMTKGELDELARKANLVLPSEPLLPAWDVYSGKVILLAVFVLPALIRFTSSESVKPKPMRVMPIRTSPLLRDPPNARLKTNNTPLTSMPIDSPSDQSDGYLAVKLKSCCSHCGQKLSFDTSFLNTSIQCPYCKRETVLKASKPSR